MVESGGEVLLSSHVQRRSAPLELQGVRLRVTAAYCVTAVVGSMYFV